MGIRIETEALVVLLLGLILAELAITGQSGVLNLLQLLTIYAALFYPVGLLVNEYISR